MNGPCFEEEDIYIKKDSDINKNIYFYFGYSSQHPDYVIKESYYK